MARKQNTKTSKPDESTSDEAVEAVEAAPATEATDSVETTFPVGSEEQAAAAVPPSIGDVGFSITPVEQINPSDEDYQRWTNGANRYFGYGHAVSVGIGTLTYDLPVLGGIFVTGDETLEDLILIPMREVAQGQFTVDEIREIVEPQVEAINKQRKADAKDKS